MRTESVSNRRQTGQRPRWSISIHRKTNIQRKNNPTGANGTTGPTSAGAKNRQA
jgi:hypothetical protein